MKLTNQEKIQKMPPPKKKAVSRVVSVVNALNIGKRATLIPHAQLNKIAWGNDASFDLVKLQKWHKNSIWKCIKIAEKLIKKVDDNESLVH